MEEKTEETKKDYEKIQNNIAKELSSRIWAICKEEATIVAPDIVIVVLATNLLQMKVKLKCPPDTIKPIFEDILKVLHGVLNEGMSLDESINLYRNI